MNSEEELVSHYNTRCAVIEKEIDMLQQKVDLLASKNYKLIAEDLQDEEIKKLLSENKKLHYRLKIMKSDVGRKDMEVDYSSVGMLSYLDSVFKMAISSAFPTIKENINSQIQLSKVADYQSNGGMSIAKILKKNPKEVGQLILNAVPPSSIISKLELSGPGFINIYIDRKFVQEQVQNLITNGVTPPRIERKKIIVDYSSPNIAKEMHVGHLRSTIIGESISRCMEFMGHDIMRINHLGDWGTQFGMLIAHLNDKYPQFLLSPPPISNLQAFYKESKQRFDEDAEFKARAYQSVVKLQSGDKSHYTAWQQICKVSLAEFDKVYKRLNVSRQLIYRGESFYQSRMECIVKELNEKELLTYDEGRMVMFADNVVPLTILKSDGGFTYDTSDMATIKNRIQEENAQWLVYVVDAGQATHFKSISACAQRAGILDPSKIRMDHVTFGVVLGEDKKRLKTRSGDTIRLVDLLDEGVERSAAKLFEKGRQDILTEEEFIKAKEAVAYGCIKYADLSHDRSRDYVFSYDRMLDFKGNTAAYLLYALTRIRSIARTAGLNRTDLLNELKKKPLELEHEKEWKLAKTLLKFTDVVVKIAQDFYIHPLCEFLYELSSVFTEFYDSCYCIEKDSSGKIVKININRLMLCEATATIMQKSFDLLGIETVEKM